MSGTYELYYEPLSATIRFKTVSAESAFHFAMDNGSLSPTDYRAKVLKLYIHEFNAEIMPMISESIEEDDINSVLVGLYRACVSLNPALDPEEWFTTWASSQDEPLTAELPALMAGDEPQKPASKKIKLKEDTRLEAFLKERVIGQDEAIEAVTSCMKRKFAGLTDSNKPLGVFLFAGPSGVGKTMLARALHQFLVDGEYDLVRIDCGEYQHKHENAKLIGSPPGYIGHDEGGQLTNRIINNPDSVVLFDEIEKAHPDFMNTLLRVLDEAVLTDSQGRRVMFNRTIIIMTTNLGNTELSKDLTARGVGFGGEIYKKASYDSLPSRQSIVERTEQAIKEHFRPEIQNRIGKIVVFNHLTDEDLRHIAQNELAEVADKLSTKKYRTIWEDSVVDYMVKVASNPVFGARAISRMRIDEIEDKLASLLLASTYPQGTVFQIVVENDELCVTTQKPEARRRSNGNNG